LTARWHVLTARVPDALHDEIAVVLGSGSLGVEVSAAGPGMSVLKVYVGSIDEAEAARERAVDVLAAHGVGAAAAQLAIDSVPDGRWVARWQASLAPIPLGERFVVLQSTPAAPPAGREPIVLIPGMAFGTGEHDTTRLAAAELERHVAAGSRWLDLGTGTGVLAIVAARCGAARVLAIDLDPDAVEVASEVVGANDCGEVVEVRQGSIDGLGAAVFDGIVANIQASFFLSHAAPLSAALAENGLLIASGFLEDDVADVGSALAASGMRIEECALSGPWACLRARSLRG
jgi:ribosomal protein L11 methyltransferase